MLQLAPTPRVAARWKARRTDIYTIPGTTNVVVGREREIEAVLASLRQHGAAVIWGGPGEGKATVAAQAAERLFREKSALSAYELDMRGEAAHLTCRVSSNAANCEACSAATPQRRLWNGPSTTHRHTLILKPGCACAVCV